MGFLPEQLQIEFTRTLSVQISRITNIRNDAPRPVTILAQAMSALALVPTNFIETNPSPLIEDVVTFIQMKTLEKKIASTHSLSLTMVVSLLIHCMCSGGADATGIPFRDLKQRTTTYLQANFSNDSSDEVLMYDDQKKMCTSLCSFT